MTFLSSIMENLQNIVFYVWDTYKLALTRAGEWSGFPARLWPYNFMCLYENCFKFYNCVTSRETCRRCFWTGSTKPQSNWMIFEHMWPWICCRFQDCLLQKNMILAVHGSLGKQVILHSEWRNLQGLVLQDIIPWNQMEHSLQDQLDASFKILKSVHFS